ncbi:hypothetical protein J2X66_000002 [Pseudomonas sp. 3296]|nr:hypothetical protein [Pseudomonas sp. 3296]
MNGDFEAYKRKVEESCRSAPPVDHYNRNSPPTWIENMQKLNHQPGGVVRVDAMAGGVIFPISCNNTRREKS